MEFGTGAIVVFVLVLSIVGCVLGPPGSRLSDAYPSTTSTPVASASRADSDGWKEAAITIGDASFAAEVADTTRLRSLGLGGRESLGVGRGMWFDLGVAREASFWMRGMRFPIDIVWVSEGLAVVGVTAWVPMPVGGTVDGSLPLYHSEVPVRYVLEINAGRAADTGIAIGDTVGIGHR